MKKFFAFIITAAIVAADGSALYTYKIPNRIGC